MKRAFSLIMAIFFVVIIATLGVMALGLATQTVKQSTDIYLREQAEILARSATEFAVMAMQDHNYNENCLEKVTVTYPGFTATVDIYYFDASITKNADGTDNGRCPANRVISTRDSSLFTASNTPGGTIIRDNIAILDVVVTSITEPIRYFKRTVQRP